MELSTELRNLVHESVALLGQVIQRELGEKYFLQIESIRQQMTDLRSVNSEDSFSVLKKSYKALEKLNKNDRHQVAKSFTLMLELINACENAYRTHRLKLRKTKHQTTTQIPEAIVYVLTAHPTEARSPQNISAFHPIQNILVEVLDDAVFSDEKKTALLHLLEIAWHTPIVRDRSPKVKDEAEHIYSMLFRDQVLPQLSNIDRWKVPFFVSSWVGGDKDGHPGVNETTLIQSLTLSRQNLIRSFLSSIKIIRETLELFPSKELRNLVIQLERSLYSLRELHARDATKVIKLKKFLNLLTIEYAKVLNSLHPEINCLNQLINIFPGLVVPLELRESSEILMTDPQDRKKLAIYKMLRTVEKISRGGNPGWYARGFIISMTESAEHLKVAAQYQAAIFGSIFLPVIPLFEEAISLKNSSNIMQEFLQDPIIRKAARTYWNNVIEMMVGYSDSSKEAGVLASRIAISEALPLLEKTCEKAGFIPLFFHGSGGSTDRGGGSIEDQTAWWPKSALRRYKVTIQGEIVERSFANPIIASRQIEKIIESASRGLQKSSFDGKNSAVDEFAEKITKHYRSTITSSEFLKLVESATPYAYLNVLKIGSRPSKRTAQLTVKGLRAIPWILCWTQTRVLFPIWWGVGKAWEQSSTNQKRNLKQAFKNHPVFTSYIKALGFTLAKIDLSIWRMYLQESGLSSQEIKKTYQDFKSEYDKTLRCYQEICDQKELMWFRPWLGESISLRSSMIHPLNLLQILAKKDRDPHLLRVSVTGISSGMMTTG